jgi:hypothetical protein
MASRRKREQQAAAAAAAAAAAQIRRKPPVFRYALVIGCAVVTLLASFIVVPAFARQSGLHDEHLNYALAGVAVLIGIVTTKWIKSLQKQAADSGNSAPGKRRSR